MSFRHAIKIAGGLKDSTSLPENSRPSSEWKRIFVGPDGLRAGWRLLIYTALVVSLLAAFIIIRNGGVEGVRYARAHADHVTTTPLLMGWSTGMGFVLVCIATFVMSKIERRKFSTYGLSLRQAFGKDFWTGCLWGFGAISGTLLAMFLLGGFRITGIALHRTAIVFPFIAWAIAFSLAGLFEEFFLRGYAQYTLASGIGFWPAAVVFSFVFGFLHSFNAHETLAGEIGAGLFGIPLCMLIQRTGTVWCAVGFHAAYDWGQTFLYGVADSGIVPYHSLFHSTTSGPQWLSGGVVGPEANILTPIALLLVTVLFAWRHRENRYQELKPR
jgi:membrane protease YdiL (CAAX protease family)